MSPSVDSESATKSTEPASHHLWIIDGGNDAGTRYYAYPYFARGRPPLRIDVYVPDPKQQPPALRDVLRPVSHLFTGSPKIDHSATARRLITALQSWSAKLPGFEALYENMPFGSQIILEQFGRQIYDEQIHLVPVYNVEKQWLSVKQLQNAWNLPQELWPEAIELERLQLQRHLHDSVSVVSIRGNGAKEFIFKALTEDIRYFYHELKLLLTMPPHPNIISRPLYIVTERCHFGGRIGVCGMILEYHPLGTLSRMSKSRIHSTTGFQAEILWAKQIVSALLHIQQHGPGFYTGLKLSNIVLGQSKESKTPRVVLIDFEQRLGKPSWTPPEVHLPTYLMDMALKGSTKPIREQYTELLLEFNVDFTTRHKSTKYTNPEHGFCSPWPSLSRRSRESAQVFMLGKLLWCLFERAVDIDNYCGVNLFRQDAQNLSFPDFEQTPQPVRDLILRCTAGSGETRGRGLPVVVRQNRIWPRECKLEADEDFVTEKVQRIAAEWWKDRVAEAEEHLILDKRSDIEKLAAERPTLLEVYNALEKLESD
ncbi:hypothetical protein Hte_005562 [Hypoxylon texense]